MVHWEGGQVPEEHALGKQGKVEICKCGRSQTLQSQGSHGRASGLYFYKCRMFLKLQSMQNMISWKSTKIAVAGTEMRWMGKTGCRRTCTGWLQRARAERLCWADVATERLRAGQLRETDSTEDGPGMSQTIKVLWFVQLSRNQGGPVILENRTKLGRILSSVEEARPPQSCSPHRACSQGSLPVDTSPGS